MHTYEVKVSTPDYSSGVGPARIEARDEKSAKNKFLRAEKTDEESLTDAGLTVWSILEVDETA